MTPKNPMNIRELLIIVCTLSITVIQCVPVSNDQPDNLSRSLEMGLAKQRTMDCRRFQSDLIECFAYNIFRQHVYLFLTLHNKNMLDKPVLSRRFKNQSVLEGSNVTLTCQTQTHSRPTLFFYKLDSAIVTEYSGTNLTQNAHLLTKYAKCLIDPNSQNITTNNARISVEWLPGTIDTRNGSHYAQLETTVNLHITNTTSSDRGYYLCIVGTSSKTFRVTHAFVNIRPREQFAPGLVDDGWYVAAASLLLLMDQDKLLALGFTAVVVLIFILLACVTCYCCAHVRRTMHKPKCRSNSNSNAKNTCNLVKINNTLEKEKTLGSMKRNFVPVSVAGSRTLPQTSSLSSYIANEKHDTLHLCTNRNANSFIDKNFDLEYEFPREKLQIGPLIDEGAFGCVHLTEAFGIVPNRYKSTVAVKMLKENASHEELGQFIKELNMLKAVGKHENIVSLLGCCTRTVPILVIVEHAKFGNLRSFLRTQRPKDFYDVEHANSGHVDHRVSGSSIMQLYANISKTNKLSETPERRTSVSSTRSFCTDGCSSTLNKSLHSTTIRIVDLLRFSVQVANGMQYLHEKKVFHRDLAARNVVLDERKVAKVADFGMTRDYYHRTSESPLAVKWVAPECLFDRKTYQNSDVWSFGVLMWEVFTLGGNPYPSLAIENLFDYLKEGKRMGKPVYCDDETYQIILDCWHFRPDCRPTFSVIHDKLTHLLTKHEMRRTNQKHMLQMEMTLLKEQRKTALCCSASSNTLGLDFNKYSCRQPTRFGSSRVTTPGSTLLSPTSSASLLAMLSSTATNSPFHHATPPKPTAPPTPLRRLELPGRDCSGARQSESDDSQYFTELTDASYASSSSSGFSRSTTHYFDYTLLPMPDEATLAKQPPSPPLLTHSSKLLKVASAAYNL